MDVSEMIANAGGVGALARELGVDEGTAQQGLGALLPAVLGGFKSQAQSHPEGLGGFAGMLEKLGGGGLADNVTQAGPTNVDAGNGVLSQIFGSRDVSKTVADDAATKTGLPTDLLKKMLPMVAMLAAGHMAKQAGGGQGGGGLGGVLGSVLGGLTGSGGGGNAPAQGGLGGLASMLGLHQDGNALTDILGMAGKLVGR